MAFTNADVVALERALVRGELSVTFSDRTTMFKATGEIIKALQYIKAQLATRPTQSLGVATKGFDE